MTPAAPSDDTDLVVIAQRLQSAREQAGQTLDELSAATGLSKAHLSRLESGNRQPSVAALIGLARALDAPVSWLLGEAATPSSTLAVHDVTEPSQVVNGVHVSSASGYAGSSVLEAMRMVIDTDRAPSPPVRHRGEEWIYVLRGLLHLEYDGALVAIGAGSSAHFDADRPHRLIAHNEQVEVLVVAADRPKTLRGLHR